MQRSHIKGKSLPAPKRCLCVVVGAYNKDKIVRRAKAVNPMDPTKDSDDDNSKTARDVRRDIVTSKMKVAEL